MQLVGVLLYSALSEQKKLAIYWVCADAELATLQADS